MDRLDLTSKHANFLAQISINNFITDNLTIVIVFYFPIRARLRELLYDYSMCIIRAYIIIVYCIHYYTLRIKSIFIFIIYHLDN